MNYYGARVHVRALPSNPDHSMVGVAWITIYVGANTTDEASRLVSDYLNGDCWDVIQFLESGQIDPERSVNRDAILAGISEHGIFVLIDGVTPTDDRNFSKS